jgi:hypothetical protein
MCACANLKAGPQSLRIQHPSCTSFGAPCASMKRTRSGSLAVCFLCTSAVCGLLSGVTAIRAQKSQDDAPGGGRVMISDIDKARSASLRENVGGGKIQPIYRANTRPQKQKPAAVPERQRTEAVVAPTGPGASKHQPQPKTEPDLKATKLTRPRSESNADLKTISLGSARSLGVTIWRLQPNATFADFNQAACLPTTRSIGVGSELQRPKITSRPLRVSQDTLFRTGDRVRLSIESPRPGYLYIINREVYGDQSFGAPKVIFPTQRIRSGNNYLAPGSPVEFPDLCDNANYFEFLPLRGERKPVAESLTMIVTDRPLTDVGVPRDALRISTDWMAAWEARWSGRTNVYDLEAGEGQPYTEGELNAGYEIRTKGQPGTRELGQGSPQPQTLYSVDSRGDGVMATLLLWYE